MIAKRNALTDGGVGDRRTGKRLFRGVEPLFAKRLGRQPKRIDSKSRDYVAN